MKKTFQFRLILVTMVFCWFAEGDCPGAPEGAPKVSTPEGYSLQVVAEYPLVENPALVRLDGAGGVWVLEKTLSPPGQNGKKKPRLDRITLLSNPGKEGRFTKTRPFLELDQGLDFQLRGQWMYALSLTSLQRRKISGPDQPENLQTPGAGDYSLEGMALGLDGRAQVFARENAAASFSNRVLFCSLPGEKWEKAGEGLALPVPDIFHSRDGRQWVVDRVAVGNGWETRLYEFFPDADYGNHHQAKEGRASDLEVVLKAVFKAPGRAGIPCLSGNPKITGVQEEALLVPFPDQGVIQIWQLPTGEGAGRAAPKAFAKGEVGSFYPAQAAIGPGNSLLVLDRGRPWEGYKDEFKPSGRILRFLPNEKPDEPVNGPLGETDWEKLTALLIGDDDWRRKESQEEIFTRAAKEPTFALKILSKEDEIPLARVLALHSLGGAWGKEIQEACLQALESGIPELQTGAAEYLSRYCPKKNEPVFNALLKQLGTEQPQVRPAVIRAMGMLNAPGTAEILVNSALFYEGGNPRVIQAFRTALRAAGKEGLDRLLAAGDSGVKRDLQKALEFQVALQTADSASAIPAWLANPNLTSGQKAMLLRSLLFLPPLNPRDRGAILAEVTKLADNTPEVRIALAKTLPLLAPPGHPWATAFLDKALRDGDPVLRIAALKALDEKSPDILISQVGELLQDKNLPPEETLALLGAAGRVKKPDFIPLLAGRVQEEKGKDHNTIRLQAFRAIRKISEEAAFTLARSLLLHSDKELRLEAAKVLLSSAAGTHFLASKLLEGKAGPEILPLVMEAGQKLLPGNPDLKKPLGELLQAQWKQLPSDGKISGDRDQGLQVFLNSRGQSCLACHRVQGVGGALGPDLTQACGNQSGKKIVESLLFPSQEIALGFRAVTVLHQSGALTTGMLVHRDGKKLLLRDATLRDIGIPLEEVSKISPADKSLMPEFSHGQFTWGQCLDLAAFLQGKNSESLAGAVLVASAFSDSVEKNNQEILVFPTGGGFLDLQGALGKKTGNFSLRFFVHSPAQQSIPVEIAADFPLTLSINGEEGKKWGGNLQPFPPELNRLVLKKGWNEARVDFRYSPASTTLKICLRAEGLLISTKAQNLAFIP
ncbi:MAG: hypothetical protein EXR99_10200 [Gemmataceae bacterium]|nr:hypothetical protein [Gemmataceae bacterium]